MMLNLNSKGFTVIELLVVVAIVSLLIAVAIFNFSQIRLQFALHRVAYQFDQNLRKAQNLAMSAAQYNDTEIVAGYGIKLDLTALGNKKYLIYADKITDPASCNNNKTNCSANCRGNEEYDESDYLVETVDFSKDEPGIIIREINFGSDISLNFNSCDLLIRANMTSSGGLGVTDGASIVFSFENDPSKARTIFVNRAGLIKIE